MVYPMIKKVVFAEVKSSIQHRVKTKCHIFFHVACLNRMVSQHLVELQRTLNGQNGIHFHFQKYIAALLAAKMPGLLGPFPQILGLLEKNIFSKVMSTSFFNVPPHPPFTIYHIHITSWNFKFTMYHLPWKLNNLQVIINPKLLEIENWNLWENVHPPLCVTFYISCVTFHVSCVMCPVSCVICPLLGVRCIFCLFLLKWWS